MYMHYITHLIMPIIRRKASSSITSNLLSPLVIVAFLVILFIVFKFFSFNEIKAKKLKLLSWNMAAINNNPFGISF